MGTAAVICEFNPFHNGHRRIIARAREAGAERVIALMSGDYVQRGAPALFSRHVRARAALLGGADIVLSLPARYSTASAETFAAAGVAVLDALHSVDLLVFGCEAGDPGSLIKCAEYLAEEPADYGEKLRRGLKRGLSYPRARAEALPEYSDILRHPNNILGVEYIKALIRSGSAMRPVPARREGEGYHGEAISEYSSASALRGRILRGDMSSVRIAVPKEAAGIYEAELLEGRVLSGQDFSAVLGEKLMSAEDVSDLACYEDVTEDLARTMLKRRAEFSSFGGFAELCASKSLTASHARRALLHTALGIRRGEDGEYGLVTQVLGFREEAAGLLGRLRAAAGIPVVTNPPADLAGLKAEAGRTFSEELRVSDIYRAVMSVKTGDPCGREIAEPIVKV